MYFTNIKPAIRRPQSYQGLSFGSPAFSQKPFYNVRQNDQSWTLEIALPGFAKENIQMEINQDLLSIVAKPNPELAGSPDSKLYHKEFSIGEKKIQFHLNDKMKTTDISAKLENGILSIQIPAITPAVSPAVNIEIK